MKTLLTSLLLLAPLSMHAADDFFQGRKGCFLLYDMKAAKIVQTIGEENCTERFPACSSFKVPLAVIGFDSGIVKDENTVWKWDDVKRDRDVQNRDHNAKTWLSESIVWFSQKITRDLGMKRMKEYLKKFQYGNKNLSQGLTTAWLVSPADRGPALKISAYEQVEFMKKLWTDKLPVSKRSMALTRELIFLETSPKGYRLSGKTGSNYYDKEKKQHFGWFVAHLQKGDEQYIAVTNFSDLGPSTEEGYGGPKAKAVTKKILESRGLW